MFPLLAQTAVENGSPYWPFLVLAVGMVFVVVMIAVLRVHAFLALILAAMLVGFLADELPGSGEQSHWIRAIDLPMQEFGNTAGKIAWVIALASVIGICMMESGAADKIVRRMMSLLGERRAAWALLISGFILGIPVFFDTVFFLLIPLAQALSLRLGKNYVLYVIAICGGAVITHSLVPPTPGPLFMVEALGLNLGMAIIFGIFLGLVPAVVVVWFGRRLDPKMPIPVRETPGTTLKDLNAIVAKKEDQLPSFFVSILPVALPVILIATASFVGAFGGRELLGGAYPWIELFGNKYLAMFLGASLAVHTLATAKGLGFAEVGEMLAPPLATAGVIILITSAGGAFGAMIKHAGVGDAVATLAEGSGISLIFLAWLVASVMKAAQGSGTVAMITTSAMMAAVVGSGGDLPYHPIYLFAAIGFGSLTLSWMNDSGFWVVCKLSGFTEGETLKSWTMLLLVLSITGIIEVSVLAKIWPHPFAP